MLRLRVRSAAATVLLATALSTSACAGPSPAPATPSPSPTPASDEEAFRAAEETYRAYVDALNAVDLADPTTFEPVFALTTGELKETDRAGLERYHHQGARVTGESVVLEATGIRNIGKATDLAVCLDVSGVSIEDASGRSLIEADRVDVQSLLVRVEGAGRESTAIASISGRSGAPLC